tara:strand:- start:286 stop:747 length:462 start_codon:yes stop_codon:yes gene_type:complete
MILLGRVINGLMLGLLGFLVINDSVKIRKLNDIERFLYRISNDVKDIKETLEQKEYNDFLNGIDDNKESTMKKESSNEEPLKEVKNIATNFLEEEKNEETGETNPNLIYDDNTEEKSSDTSSDGWKEVRTDSENNSEEKNNECDKVEKTTKIE